MFFFKIKDQRAGISRSATLGCPYVPSKRERDENQKDTEDKKEKWECDSEI
ncbi:MAG: hypothetical protein MUF77_01560 [Leptospira sp.]|nr:hypothetical protein [Leptospira sp.]